MGHFIVVFVLLFVVGWVVGSDVFDIVSCLVAEADLEITI